MTDQAMNSGFGSFSAYGSLDNEVKKYVKVAEESYVSLEEYVKCKSLLARVFNPKVQDFLVGAGLSAGISNGTKYAILAAAGTTALPVAILASAGAGAAVGIGRAIREIHKERQAAIAAGNDAGDWLTSANGQRILKKMMYSSALSTFGGGMSYAFTHMNDVASLVAENGASVSRAIGFEAGAKFFEKAPAALEIARGAVKHYASAAWDMIDGQGIQATAAQVPSFLGRVPGLAKNGLGAVSGWLSDQGHTVSADVSGAFDGIASFFKHASSGVQDWVAGISKKAMAAWNGETAHHIAAATATPTPTTDALNKIASAPQTVPHAPVTVSTDMADRLAAAKQLGKGVPDAVAYMNEPPAVSTAAAFPDAIKVQTITIHAPTIDVTPDATETVATPTVVPTEVVAAPVVTRVEVTSLTSSGPTIEAATKPVFQMLPAKPFGDLGVANNPLMPQTTIAAMAEGHFPLMATLPNEMPNMHGIADPFTGKQIQFPMVKADVVPTAVPAAVTPDVANVPVTNVPTVSTLPTPGLSINDKLAQLVEGKHLRGAAKTIYKHALAGDAQGIKDMAKAVANGQFGFEKNPQRAIELYNYVKDMPDIKANMAAKLQANVDLAYLKFHGAGDIVANHKEAIAEMAPLAKKSSLARSLLAEWTGKPLKVHHHAAAAVRHATQHVHEKVASHVGKAFGDVSCVETRKHAGSVMVKCRGFASDLLKNVKPGSNFDYISK